MLCVVTLFIHSCSGDSPEEMVGPVEDISFADQVQVIFNQSCGGAGCHVSSSQSGVNLSTYDDVMNSVGEQYNREIVDPGNPDESPLVDKIEPAPEHGQRMPFDRDPLSEQQIRVIRTWIEEGALDN